MCNNQVSNVYLQVRWEQVENFTFAQMYKLFLRPHVYMVTNVISPKRIMPLKPIHSKRSAIFEVSPPDNYKEISISNFLSYLLQRYFNDVFKINIFQTY